MGDNKFNYVVGIALIVVLVLVVYLGGRIKMLEDGVTDLFGRVANIESFLTITTAEEQTSMENVESVPVDEFVSEEVVSEEELSGYGLGAFEGYYDDEPYYVEEEDYVNYD